MARGEGPAVEWGRDRGGAPKGQLGPDPHLGALQRGDLAPFVVFLGALNWLLIVAVNRYGLQNTTAGSKHYDFTRCSVVVSIGNFPAWHRVLPGPWGLEPQKSPKRVPKGVPGPPALGSPRVPKSAPRSPKRVQKHGFGLFFKFFRPPGRTLWGLWGSPAPETPRHSCRLFSKGLGALCARPGGS